VFAVEVKADRTSAIDLSAAGGAKLLSHFVLPPCWLTGRFGEAGAML
jgi:hypothetical protein